MWRWSVLVAAFILLSATPVSAGKSADKKAAEIATRAVKLYRQGKMKEAAEQFLEAFNISKRRAQLRNAAKAYEEGGYLDDSLALWRRFEENEGSSTDEKAEAEAHEKLILEKKKNAEAVKSAEEAKLAEKAARLEAEEANKRAEEAARQAAERSSAAQAAAPIPPPREESAPVAGYLLVGGGVAMLIGSGALWLLAQGRLKTLDDKLAMKNAQGQITGISPDDADREVSAINMTRIGAGALAGAGAIAIGVGVVWLLVSGSEDHSIARTGPSGSGARLSPLGLAVQF